MPKDRGKSCPANHCSDLDSIQAAAVVEETYFTALASLYVVRRQPICNTILHTIHIRADKVHRTAQIDRDGTSHASYYNKDERRVETAGHSVVKVGVSFLVPNITVTDVIRITHFSGMRGADSNRQFSAVRSSTKIKKRQTFKNCIY